jgi:SpoVK/Ycf46/Vps4 family AAA+-type ATPase
MNLDFQFISKEYNQLMINCPGTIVINKETFTFLGEPLFLKLTLLENNREVILRTMPASFIDPGKYSVTKYQQIELGIYSAENKIASVSNIDINTLPYVNSLEIEVFLHINAKSICDTLILTKELTKASILSLASASILSLASASILSLASASIYAGSVLKCNISNVCIVKPIHMKHMHVRIDMFTHILIMTNDPLLELTTNNESEQLFNYDFDLKAMGIGGLNAAFDTMLRRAFIPRSFSKNVKEELGIKDVKGMLLYGPPGCGKTAIARQIGKILNCEKPIVVSGPSLLSKWVGASEENVRLMFDPAFENPSKLYMIILDEADSLLRKRGGDSTGNSDKIVNQFLAMIDGPEQLSNILIIALTNRKDIIDEAILRPGRLEVHIEIGLPDELGRFDILDIYTNKWSKTGCMNPDINLHELAHVTKGYTGAELEGLTVAAMSHALRRQIDLSSNKVVHCSNKKIYVEPDDFAKALENDINPMFGKMSDKIKNIINKSLSSEPGIVCWCDELDIIKNAILNASKTIRKGYKSIYNIIGPSNTGKTLLACDIAQNSNYCCVRIISPDEMVKHTLEHKLTYIHDIFHQVQKAESGFLIIDQFDRLIEWTASGERFNQTLFNTLISYTQSTLDSDSRIIIYFTLTHNNEFKRTICSVLDIEGMFDEIFTLPVLIDRNQIKILLEKSNITNIDENHPIYFETRVCNVLRHIKHML